MSLVSNLLRLKEASEDLSKLPRDVMTAIKANIRKGAENLEQNWANALELVQKAYEIEGVQRPEPSMESAWKQYEENLTYAVQQLSENRGMDGDWRMSSSMFHEALESQNRYKVNITGGDGDESYIIEAKNFDAVVDLLKESTGYEVSVEQNSFRDISVSFSRWGIHKKTKLNVERLT